MRGLTLFSLALFVAVIGLAAVGPLPAGEFAAACAPPQSTVGVAAPVPVVVVAPARHRAFHRQTQVNGCSGGSGGCQGFVAGSFTVTAVAAAEEMQGCAGGQGCSGGQGGTRHRGPVRRLLFGD